MDRHLTGHGSDPEFGIESEARVRVRAKEGVKIMALRATASITSDDLPLRITFQGRQYVLRETRAGGLLLNGA